MKTWFVAAHGGFANDRVPLGGGAAVCAHLMESWARSGTLDVHLLHPSILGPEAPRHDALVRMSEWAYARFCRQFERAATQRILREGRPGEAVLCNDVSEGPDFERLAAAGFRLYTIYHVDVLDYVMRLYARGRVSPVRAAGVFRCLERWGARRWMPSILQLIFQKQEDSVRHSRGLIVPSRRMREVLESCYPGTAAGKVQVIPWGIWSDPVDDAGVEVERSRWAMDLAQGGTPWILLTLSRISPEKGQDRLLEALALWEQSGDYPERGITLVVAGEAAFMHGVRFLNQIQRLASRLGRTRVVFAGYAAGARKQALFRMADLYVFPSRHESYGLTMMEAMQAGLPVLATATHGASDVFVPGTGLLIEGPDQPGLPARLLDGLRRLLADPDRLKHMGQAGRDAASRQPFDRAADRIAAFITNGSI